MIAVPGGRRAGLAVVLDPGVGRGDEPRPLVLTEDRWAGRLSSADFPTPVAALGRMRLPKNVNHRVARGAPRPRVVAAQHRHRRAGAGAPAAGKQAPPDDDPELGDAAPGAARAPLPRLRRPGGARPVGRAARPAGARDRAAAAEGRAPPRTRWRARSTGSAALLGERGYLVRDGGGRPSPQDGQRLARLWGESDLLAAECLRHGRVGRPGARRAGGGRLGAGVRVAPRRRGRCRGCPRGRCRDALAATVRLWAGLEADERRHRVDRTREPDLGFAWPVHRWARGESLSAVLDRRRAERRRALGGRLRAVVPAGPRPARPDRRRRRAGQRGRPGRGGGGGAVRRGVVAVGAV